MPSINSQQLDKTLLLHYALFGSWGKKGKKKEIKCYFPIFSSLLVIISEIKFSIMKPKENGVEFAFDGL